MRRALLSIFLLLACLLGLSLALTAGEIAALQNLVGVFPGLRRVNALDEYDDDYIHYGGSWPIDLTTACLGGNGWRIHGIYCENDAITGIRLYVAPVRIGIFFRYSKRLITYSTGTNHDTYL